MEEFVERVVSGLSMAALDVTPTRFDFSEGTADSGPGIAWEVVHPDASTWEFDQCLAYLEDLGGGEPEVDAARWGERAAEGEHDVASPRLEALREACARALDKGRVNRHPVADSYYVVPGGDLDDMADVIEGMCFVAVQIGGVPALAPAVGGMDLSWEICESFVLCGYLPPAYFARERAVAERVPAESDHLVLAACARSLELRPQEDGSALAAIEARIEHLVYET